MSFLFMSDLVMTRLVASTDLTTPLVAYIATTALATCVVADCESLERVEAKPLAGSVIRIPSRTTAAHVVLIPPSR
jgi:hypothetical protein